MAKAKAAAPTKNLPATKTSTAVGHVLDFSADAGAGFEGAGREAFAIPFLTVLQSMSPQCKKSDGAYIKGAEEGMVYNNVTGEVFDGNEGVELVPCAFTQTFVEWHTRESGGGLVAEYDSVAGMALRGNCKRDDKNRDILPNGNQLNDTRNHYVLFKDSEGHWQPALLSLTSTQIKASRNWMTTMQRTSATSNVPMFAQRYTLTTTPQSNDKGSWYGVHFEFVGLVEDEETYTQAKAFYTQAKTGGVKASPREGAEGNPNTGVDFDDDPEDM